MSPVTADDAGAAEHQTRRRPRRRRTRVLIVIGSAALAAGAVLVAADPFGGDTSSTRTAMATSVASVTRQDLSSRTTIDGTLGYAGSYAVSGQAGGTVTAVPGIGQVVNQGEVLYEVNLEPVLLLYGDKPAYRALSRGTSGEDVTQLNAALDALGYDAGGSLDPTSDEFNWATEAAVEDLQGAHGLDDTGELELGDVVFLPSAIRVTEVPATIGGSATGQILTASSTTRIVTVSLNAAQQSQVQAGDAVTITLPDRTTTPGVVFSVGTVATTTGDSDTPKVEVIVVPTDAAATGTLDQAPVGVSIVTATVEDALVVPVNALVARAGGDYAVEVVDERGVHRLVSVELGLFDDSAGLVQITGSGVKAGQRVVVPSI